MAKQLIYPKVLLPIILIIGGVLGAYALGQAKKPPERRTVQPRPPLVQTIMLQPETVRYEVHSQGRIEPRLSAALIAQVSGTVIETHPNFYVGGDFQKGEVLLKLDDRDYKLALARAEAQVAAAEQLLSRTEAEAEQARYEWNELGKRGTPSPLVLKEPQLAEARARLRGAKADLEIARLNLQRVEIKAPFEGRIDQKQVDIGHFMRVGEAAAHLYTPKETEVRLPLHDEELKFLPDGLFNGGSANAILRGEFAGKTHEWPATIRHSEGRIDPQTRLITLVARTASENSPPVGQFVKATILGKEAHQVFVIPPKALHEKEKVLLINPDERLTIQPVQVLRTEPARTIIRQGANPGDRVIVSPLEVIIEGMQIEIEPNQAAS
ncbi:MAG: efflux RND transporter periplasmic adaptor subunit [Gammaproteobacteria bacterium]|nr:efflux RND transporter periplasmic adaptor subunit [Gammaproteobacteria bacterium]